RSRSAWAARAQRLPRGFAIVEVASGACGIEDQSLQCAEPEDRHDVSWAGRGDRAFDRPASVEHQLDGSAGLRGVAKLAHALDAMAARRRAGSQDEVIAQVGGSLAASPRFRWI